MTSRVRVKLVEVGNTKGEISIGEQLDRLGLCGIRQQYRRARRVGALRHEGGKLLATRPTITDYNPRRMQVVEQSASLAQELWREDDVRTWVSLLEAPSEPDGHRRLHHHRSIGHHTYSLSHDRLHRRRIEEVVDRVVISGCSDHDYPGTFDCMSQPC